MPVVRIAKKLCQSALSSTAVARYTTPSNTTTQITEIWLANTNAETERTVTLYAHGTGTTNIILPAITIEPKDTQLIHAAKIVLSEGEVLAAKQNIGTDVIMTAYGIEEVSS